MQMSLDAMYMFSFLLLSMLDPSDEFLLISYDQ